MFEMVQDKIRHCYELLIWSDIWSVEYNHSQWPYLVFRVKHFKCDFSCSCAVL